MKKIKLIFTGGTIGSLVNDNEISTNAETRSLLIEKSGENKDIFEASFPLNILSENATPDDVLKMYDEIMLAMKDEQVEGIILTHGTDTLAFTAGYLSLLLQKCSKKVVLVSSNFPITYQYANGIINFKTAIEIVENENFPNGVYVSYKNPCDNFVSIHLGSRIMEPSPFSDCFYSVQGLRYAKFQNGKFEFENTGIGKTYKNFEIDKTCWKIDKKILFIKPFIGLNYDLYKNSNFDCVVHELFHSGTANVNEKQDCMMYNLLNFADFCNQNNKPLFVCNISKKDVNYNSTNIMLNKNIKFLFNIAPNIALTKVNIAFSLIKENEREKFLKTNIAGEYWD